MLFECCVRLKALEQERVAELPLPKTRSRTTNQHRSEYLTDRRKYPGTFTTINILDDFILHYRKDMLPFIVSLLVDLCADVD